jgi:hypothetical protein
MQRNAAGEWVLESAGAHRVWELVESLPLEGLAHRHNPLRHGCDRHTLRLVEEAGFTRAYTYGVGHEIHVEDAWFDRPDFTRLPATAVAS